MLHKIQIPTDEAIALDDSVALSDTKIPKKAPFPTSTKATGNIANRNDPPNFSLGTNVIGPFLRKRVSPKVDDITLNANVAMKK